MTQTAGVRGTSYLERLLVELDSIHEQFKIVLDSSAIKNIDPNRSYSGPVFIGYPSWGWETSEPRLSRRMKLLGQLRDWMPRLRLLFPHPTPTVAERLDDGLAHLERWLTREPGDHSITGHSTGPPKLASTIGGGARAARPFPVAWAMWQCGDVPWPDTSLGARRRRTIAAAKLHRPVNARQTHSLLHPYTRCAGDKIISRLGTCPGLPGPGHHTWHSQFHQPGRPS